MLEVVAVKLITGAAVTFWKLTLLFTKSVDPPVCTMLKSIVLFDDAALFLRSYVVVSWMPLTSLRARPIALPVLSAPLALQTNVKLAVALADVPAVVISPKLKPLLAWPPASVENAHELSTVAVAGIVVTLGWANAADETPNARRAAAEITFLYKEYLQTGSE